MYVANEKHGINVKETLWIISVDLGQANDYTAISVLQRNRTGFGILGDDKNGIRELNLLHLERMRELEYPSVVERIKEIYLSDALKGFPKAVAFDMTGLGRPVHDMMKQAGFYYSLNPISITGGNETHTTNIGGFNVPKRELVTRLQICLQNGELHIAEGLKEAKALVNEMTNFQTQITKSGQDTYNAKTGTHDDIVLSVAMGVWLACRNRIYRYGDDKHM